MKTKKIVNWRWCYNGKCQYCSYVMNEETKTNCKKYEGYELSKEICEKYEPND